MSAMFKQVTIVGLGLIGGSLGMAIRRRRLARRVVGLSRTEATLRAARRRGAIDIGTTDEADAVREADLVVLAVPVDRIVPQAKRLSRLMRPGSILTDVGSTKGSIVNALTGRLPRGVAFVGAHPLAGSEQRGIMAARMEVFQGSTCVVTKTAASDPRAVARMRTFWTRLADRVVVMTPERHDRLIAQVSHLPHVLAFCLVDATSSDALAVAPRSFLEATRVAKSDPELWDAILRDNRAAILEALGAFERRCRRMRRALDSGPSRRLVRFLHHAQAIRQALRDDPAGKF